MKVDFIGFKGNRQNHQDWAFGIIAETDFEKSFFQELFDSDAYHPTRKIKQMQPIAALIAKEGSGIAIIVAAENFCESELAKARKRITELEKLLDEQHNQDKPEAPQVAAGQ